MKMRSSARSQNGFSLLELLVAMALFLIICGAAFTLLGVSQKRYQTDSQILNAFQEARIGMDQMVRDVNDSGFPPRNHFSSSSTPVSSYASTPVAWAPNYLVPTPCTIGTTCTSPTGFELIIETDYDNDGTVDWIRYQLNNNILYRGVLSKSAGTDPDPSVTTWTMVPYVTNVMNNASSTQIAQFNALHSGMFPGGAPVPIFTYTCDTPTGTVACTSAGAYNSPQNIRDVAITLIVQTPNRDAQTGGLRLVTLNGRGHRVNPNQ
jgi:prepilin-type N-terminal cleavage/methylation domain-containing protein